MLNIIANIIFVSLKLLVLTYIVIKYEDNECSYLVINTYKKYI